jgi:hypothetical protein
MQRYAALALVWLMLFSATACRKYSEADQKWLRTVEKMVQLGCTRFSTSSTTQADLLKTWAKAHGYAVGVSKTAAGFHIELMKCAAPRPVVAAAAPKSK